MTGRTPSLPLIPEPTYWCVGCEAWVPSDEPCQHLTNESAPPRPSSSEDSSGVVVRFRRSLGVLHRGGPARDEHGAST